MKKCVKTNAERLVGGGSRSPGKPVFWQFAKANGQKAALMDNIIICISVDKIYLKEYFLFNFLLKEETFMPDGSSGNPASGQSLNAAPPPVNL